MTKTDNRMRAIALVQSPRGQYIMSQALTVAIAALADVEIPRREVSNIEDMEFIRDHVFPLYHEVHGDFITEYRKLAADIATREPDILVDPLGEEADDE